MMKLLVYLVFGFHLLWLLGCIHYCIFIYLQNHQGHPKNELLRDNKLKVIFTMVVAWFFYIIYLTYEFYTTNNADTWHHSYDTFGWISFLLSNKLSLELLNLGSSIICTLFLLGYKFGDK